MGVEYITQPQIFVNGLTALGPGIQGLTENYPLLTTYNHWTSTSVVEASSFPIPDSWSIYSGTNNSASFIVSIGGTIQPPSTYSIDILNRLLTFSSVVSSGIEIAVTQLATAAPSSQDFNFVKSVSAEFTSTAFINNLSSNAARLNSLTATNLTTTNLFVTNLTALSSVLNVVDITQLELSGFNISGGLSATSANINTVNSTNITLANTGSLIGTTSATSINIGALSARSFALIHEPANDGVDPILDIGETQTNSFSGFRIRYEEPTNRLIGSSRTGTTILTSFMITTNTGQVGISGLPAPGQALTVAGNISASGNIQAENLSKYYILSADLTPKSVGSITPFLDTAATLNLANNKNYEINYNLYYANNTTAAGALRFILSASNVLNYANVNYITTNTAGISGGNLTPQMGSMFAPTTSILILPSLAYSGSTFQNTLIQTVVQVNNACSFNIAVSGNATNVASSIIAKRGSSQIVQLME